MQYNIFLRKTRGDPVLHIDLRKWAGIAIIAPLDANTLAKVITLIDRLPIDYRV